MQVTRMYPASHNTKDPSAEYLYSLDLLDILAESNLTTLFHLCQSIFTNTDKQRLVKMRKDRTTKRMLHCPLQDLNL